MSKKPFESTVVKRENPGINQHFLLFPCCFLSCEIEMLFVSFSLSSANAFNLDKSKISLSRKGLGPRMKIKSHYQLTNSHTMTPFDAPGKQAF